MTHCTACKTFPGDPIREVITASWLTLNPMLLGGVNVSPDDDFVTLTTRDTVSPEFGRPGMRVESSLDSETLDLKPDPVVRSAKLLLYR